MLVQQDGRPSLRAQLQKHLSDLRDNAASKGVEARDAAFVISSSLRLYFAAMSIRNRAGEWEPLLLGIEPENCGVCNQVLYRNTTMLKGGWERCSVCNRFVHYACLAGGKVQFLKRRPRVCLNCEQK